IRSCPSVHRRHAPHSAIERLRRPQPFPRREQPEAKDNRCTLRQNRETAPRVPKQDAVRYTTEPNRAFDSHRRTPPGHTASAPVRNSATTSPAIPIVERELLG